VVHEPDPVYVLELSYNDWFHLTIAFEVQTTTILRSLSRTAVEFDEALVWHMQLRGFPEWDRIEIMDCHAGCNAADCIVEVCSSTKALGWINFPSKNYPAAYLTANLANAMAVQTLICVHTDQ
jgi:hypothetical protein